MAKTTKIDFIEIKGNKIHYGFNVFYKKDGDMYSCYIPAYDVYFSCAKDEETMGDRAQAIVSSFYDYWLDRESGKLFIYKILKLGFKAKRNHHIIRKQLLGRGSKREARFSSNLITNVDFDPSVESDVQVTVLEETAVMA